MSWHPTPAGALWAGGLAWFLAVDAVLVHKGLESASEWYARNWKRLIVITVLVLAHLHGRVPVRWDPFHQVAERLRPKVIIVGVPVAT